MEQQVGFIYKLTSPNTDLIYIGATIQTLRNRFNTHKSQKEKSNITSKKIIEAGEAKIELIEVVTFTDKKELHIKEKEYIKQYKDKCVNERAIFLSEKERASVWREKNREKIREYDRNKRQQYREQNPLPPLKTEEEKKEYKKKYHQEHKEEKSQYDKEYREKNKEYQNERIECECGGFYQRRHKSSHLKTNKHIRGSGLVGLDIIYPENR